MSLAVTIGLIGLDSLDVSLFVFRSMISSCIASFLYSREYIGICIVRSTEPTHSIFSKYSLGSA